MQTMMLKMFEIHRQKQAEQREEEKRSAEEQATQDEHLDTIPEMESDEVIKSSVENLVQTPNFNKDSEIFSNPLFDSKANYTSSDDESSSEENVPVENFKIYSKPLLEFDEEIFSSEINPLYNEVLEDLDSIPPGIENDHFNAESDLIESLFNKDIVITSPKIVFLLEEFAEELNSEISDAIIESFSSSPILVKDSDSLMEEIDIFLAADGSIRPGIKNDDYDSEGDVLFLEELLNNDSISLPEYESFHVDFYNVPSSPHPPEKPPDDDVYFDIEPDTGVLTTKVVDDISNTSTRELYGHVPNVLTTLPTLYLVFDTLLPFSSKNEDKVFNHGILIPKKEKSPPLLSHRGFEDYPDYEDSRARGFVQRSLDLHPFACLFWESYILDLID
ncbi:hypothetical protein Tco_1571545 [Tanacetum coccineum]